MAISKAESYDTFLVRSPEVIPHKILSAIATYEHDVYTALSDVCQAVEASARKHGSDNEKGRSKFISFIRDHMWIIELFSGMAGEVALGDMRFRSFYTEEAKPRLIKDPDFAAIAYYKYRCRTQHGSPVDADYHFAMMLAPGISIGRVDPKNNLANLPQSVVFGMIAAVIYADCNIDIKTSTGWHFHYNLVNHGGPNENIKVELDEAWGTRSELLNEIVRKSGCNP